MKEAILIKLNQDYLVKEPNAIDQSINDPGVNTAILKYQQSTTINDYNEGGSGDNNNSNSNSNSNQVPNSIKLVKYPDYFPEWKNQRKKVDLGMMFISWVVKFIVNKFILVVLIIMVKNCLLEVICMKKEVLKVFGMPAFKRKLREFLCISIK